MVIATVFAVCPVYADNKAGILNSLGIDLEEKDIAEYVTRAEFAKSIVALSGMDGINDTYDFADVPNEYKSAASAACALGYMNYYEDLTFHPDEYMTVGECAKALVIMLGYRDLAKLLGGYVNAAKKLELFKNSASNFAKNITYGELQTAYYNALLTEVGNFLGAENVNKQTFLEIVYKGNIYEGRVTATAYCSADGNATGSKNFVHINNTNYATEVDASEFFGYYVEFVVREIDGEDKITFIKPKDSMNNEVEIEAEDIISYKNRKYEFYKNDRRNTVTFSDTAAIIFNGGTASDIDESDMIPTDGKIKLVDNNRDSLYDVVFITSPELKEVSSVNANEMSLYCSDGTGYETKNYDEVIFDGVSINEIKKGSVINVFKNTAAGVIRIVGLTDTLSGKLTSKSGEELTIDGDTYKLASNVIYETQPEIGKNINVIFDYAGRIAKVSVTSSKNVGYLISAIREDSGETVVYAKMVNSDGEYKIVKIAETFRVNNSVYKKPDDIIRALKFGGTEIKSRLIIYELNKDGELKKIETAYNDDANYKDELQNKPAEDCLRMIHANSFDASSEALEYRSVQRTFGMQQVFAARTNTKVFIIPKGGSSNADDYQLTDLSFFKSESKYKVDAYSYSKGDYIADVIIYYEEKAGSGVKPTMTNMKYAYVAGFGETVLEDDTVAKTIRLRMAGKTETVDVVINDDVDITKVYPYASADEGFYSLDKGDIIMYEIDTKGRMKSVMIIIDWSEPTPEQQFKGGSFRGRDSQISSWPRFQYADLYELVDGYGILCFNDLRDPSYKFVPADGRPENLEYGDIDLVIVDTKTDKVVTSAPDKLYASMSELKDYVSYGSDVSRILVVTKWGYKECLFIFN